MYEWLFFLSLVNLILLIIVKSGVKKLKKSDEVTALKLGGLQREFRELARQLSASVPKPKKQEPVVQETVLEPKPVAVAAPAAKPVQQVTKPATSVKTSGVVTPSSTKPPPVPIEQDSAPTKLLLSEKQAKLAESAGEVLTKMWRWIVFGDESRRGNMSTEVAIATTWLIRVGVLVVVMGAMYFLKWSLEVGLIPPAVRVAVSMLSGVGLLVWGLKLLGKKYHVIGQGLLGGGLLILYASSFASGPLYHLFGSVSTPAAFALMILVTITGGVVAVRTNSMIVAIIGIAGGFMTPVMLRTELPNLPGFYSYILMLSLGIMAIAYYKQWRLLNYLGFIGAYGLFFASLGEAYKPADFLLAMCFLSSFLVVHSAIVYLNNIAKGNKSTTLEIMHLVANAVCFAAAGYWLIEGKYGRPFPALMSLGLAAFYVAHILVFLKKKLADKALLIALIALAGIFATWTLPLILEKESLTICLSLIALMFLWLGGKVGSNFLQSLGHALYCVVFFRLVYWDLPRNFWMRADAGQPMSVYWSGMIDRLWTFGVAIASIVGGFFIKMKTQRTRNAELVVDAQNDTPAIVGRGVVGGVLYWSAILFIFLFAHLELNAMFAYCTSFRLPVLTVLWCLMGAYFFVRYVMSDMRDNVSLCAMSAFLLLALLKVFAFDLASWEFNYRYVYDMDYTLTYALARCVDFGAVLAMFVTVWLVGGMKRGDKTLKLAFGYGSLFILFVYATLELNSLLFWKLDEFQKGGISILWALFAIAFISGGIWKGIAALRYVGLGLFAVVVAKVFLVDMSDMDMIYRVVAFVGVGVILLLGAFAYLYADKKLAKGGQQ
jgi:uncharacterized membrane protein